MFVIDCSIMCSWLLPDEQNDVTLIFSSFIMETPYVCVPCIFYMEVMNVLEMAYRRKRIDADTRQEALAMLQTLPVIVDKAGAEPQSLDAIAQVAKKYQLTSYDASYLELASRLRLSLITLDKALIQAASAEGVLYRA